MHLWLTNTYVILFGLFIGSFLNVVIHRLPRKQSVVKPGSHCPKCKTPLRWYQNIPLFSFLLQRGKCSSCSSRISWRYPFVEFLTAVLFFVTYLDLGLGWFEVITQVRVWLFVAICIAITFIDLDHRIIPDELSLGGWLVGALTAYFDFRNGFGHLMMASLVGFGFFFAFGYLYERFTGRVGLGGGDIKFMGTIGIFLGLGGIWSSLMISSVVGAIVGLIIAKIQNKGPALKLAIPYGPFLVVGALVELIFEVSKWIAL